MSFNPKSYVISKSIFNCGGLCPCATIYALTRKEDAGEVDMQYVLDNGKAVGEFARTLYPNAAIITHSTLARQAKDTKACIDAKYSVICEASFLKDNLFCAVDILEIDSNGHLRVTEVKSSTDIKDTYYLDLAFQVYLIKKCGYEVDSANLMYVNKDYVRDGNLDPNNYFIISDVSEDVFSLQTKVESDIEFIKERLENGNYPTPEVADYCFKPYECPFWKTICKPMLPKNSVFDIRGMQTRTKIKLFYCGVCTMSDYLDTKKQNPKFTQQCLLTTTDNNEIQVNYDDLSAFLDKINFPMASLDFETIGEALPYFDGQKPYAQTPVQFSLHVLKEKGASLEHFEYLANPNIDWRIELSHKLVEYCPSEGSVIVWNQTMEKNRIEELAELRGNEDIRDALLSISSRIVDLMIPFRERVVYRESMHGSYSVKHVLPALFPDDKRLSYQDLSVNNGMLASSVFSKMLHDDMSAFEENLNRQALFTYCELDTYGPFCILEFMYKLRNPEETELFKKFVRQDSSRRTVRVGDRVSTNIGNGMVVGFTRCFTRVFLDEKYNVLRKSKNICNLSGLDFHTDTVNASLETNGFKDSTNRVVKFGDYVNTDKGIGIVIDTTDKYLKIELANGKVIRRRTVTIVN